MPDVRMEPQPPTGGAKIIGPKGDHPCRYYEIGICYGQSRIVHIPAAMPGAVPVLVDGAWWWRSEEKANE